MLLHEIGIRQDAGGVAAAGVWDVDERFRLVADALGALGAEAGCLGPGDELVEEDEVFVVLDALAGLGETDAADRAVMADRLARVGEVAVAVGVADVEPGLAVAALADVAVPAVVPGICLLYTSPSPRDLSTSRMPSSA